MNPVSRRVTIRLHRPTAGTRIAVWVFPLLTLWLGVAYLGPMDRLQSASYSGASAIVPAWLPGEPMRAWGALFVVLAVVKAGCIITGTIKGYVVAMCAGMGLYACWAVLFFGSIFFDSHASLAAPAWPLAFVALHAAVLATMQERG